MNVLGSGGLAMVRSDLIINGLYCSNPSGEKKNEEDELEGRKGVMTDSQLSDRFWAREKERAR